MLYLWQGRESRIFLCCTYGKVERVVWHSGNVVAGSSEWWTTVRHKKLSLEEGLQEEEKIIEITIHS